MDYADWRQRWVEIDDTARDRIDKLVAALPHRPTFTILVPVDGANESLVAATVRSVTAQRYPDWVLRLTCDEPRGSAVVATVDEVDDDRVQFTESASVAPSDWVARLSPGDLLGEAALFAVADVATSHSDTAVVYTDHDHVGPDGRLVDPHMKSDWNPDLLAGMNYFGILTVYRRDLWDIYAADSVDAHDLALKVVTGLEASQVVHIPHVLATLQVSGDGTHLVPTTVRVTHPLPDPPPRVSVLIPTRDRGRMLERCLSTVRGNTDYPDVEIVVVDHESTETRARKVLDGLTGEVNTRVIKFGGPFNFAAMINRAAEVATGEVLVLLNNDTEVIDNGWLTDLVAHVSRPEVGVVGALLVFGDGTIQHAGVHPGVGGLMGHGHKHRPGNDPGYFARLLVAHEVAAVTGACLAIEAATWRQLGGLDEESLAVAYNDIDLCLKARQAGLRVIFTPHARLVHHESVSRGVDDDPTRRDRLEREAAIMRGRWGAALDVDPAYNPNLSLDGEAFTPAVEPRVALQWQH